MPVVNIEPTREHPVPYTVEDDVVPTLLEELAVAGNTAELQHALGAPLEVSEGNAAREKALLAAVLKSKNPENLKRPTTALAAAAFLREYGQQLAFDVAATRAAITSKLMEIANCGDPKFELRALELLGKHSDIGLFTERSEITINYKSPEALEDAIKERVKRLLNADIIDVTPLGMNLDEELGTGLTGRGETPLVQMLYDESEDTDG
jgi:hypothetical protein